MTDSPSYDGLSTIKPSGISRTKVSVPQEKVTTNRPSTPVPSPRGHA